MMKLSSCARLVLLGLIALLSGILMFNAAKSDSAIVDELAHIPAGYSYARYLDYRLNPEHPPLVKLLSAIPLLFQNLKFPTDSLAWTRDVNGQWTIGGQFLYESGNDADKIISWARVVPIILTLILIIAIYFWSKNLMGKWWAFLPTFLFAFSPTVLAHGHYVTTDIGAAIGMFAATVAFLNLLSRPSRKTLLWAGLAFGFAQLLKFSAVLLAPYFIILAGVYFLVWRRFSAQAWHYIKSLFWVFSIGFIIVYLGYLPLTWNYPVEKQVTDAQANLSNFNPHWLAESVVWMSGSPILRPAAEYLSGFFMVLQRSSGGNTYYFSDELSNQARRDYFPLVLLMKEPVASLILIFFAFGLGAYNTGRAALAVIFRRSRKLVDYLTTHFAEFAMTAFIAIYWLSSITSNLNIGIRHILPTLPFIYILAAGGIKQWFSIGNLDLMRNFAIKISVIYRQIFSLSLKSALLAVLLIWYLASSASAAPHFLSYFNFMFGGLDGGWRYVTDSNYDWGQDLKRLKTWAESNLPKTEKIAVDYFGGGNPKYYLGEWAENWWSARGNPINEGIKWLAVSINTIQSAKAKLAGTQRRSPQDEYQWLAEPYKPHARAGTSIFIYRLGQAD